MRLGSGRRLVSPPPPQGYSLRTCQSCARRSGLDHASRDEIPLARSCARQGHPPEASSPPRYHCDRAPRSHRFSVLPHRWSRRNSASGCGDPIELPCFDRTSSLALMLMFHHLLPPSFGEFTARTQDPFPLCPSLRVLKLRSLIEVDTLILHSPLLDKFSFKGDNTDICCIDIAAPVLKQVKLKASLAKEFNLSCSAPMVKVLDWVCNFFFSFVL